MSSTSEVGLEIIEFLRPDRNDQNVYVTNLPKTLTDAAKYESLSKIFSQFGLIHEIQILDAAAAQSLADVVKTGDESAAPAAASKSSVSLKSEEETVFLHYAFVKFYSSHAAARAIQSLHQQWMMEGHLLRVQPAVSRNAPAQNSTPLYVSECRKLANHYLGFNGWSSKIAKLESFSIPDAATLDLLSDLAAEAEDSATFAPGEDQLSYSCLVQLAFPRHSVTCHGAGAAVVKPPSEGNAAGPAAPMVSAGYAKKAALQRATEDAFSRIVLIVLPSGKVAIEQVREDPPGCAVANKDISEKLIEVTSLPDRDEADGSEDELVDDGDMHHEDTPDRTDHHTHTVDSDTKST